MTDSQKSCKNCIHHDICNARTKHVEIIDYWNNEFPFLKFDKNTNEKLANSCAYYQTLSNLFVKKPTPKLVPTFEPSSELKKILVRLDQIEEIQSNDGISDKENENLDELFSEVNVLMRNLDEKEMNFFKKRVSEIPWCGFE